MNLLPVALGLGTLFLIFRSGSSRASGDVEGQLYTAAGAKVPIEPERGYQVGFVFPATASATEVESAAQSFDSNTLPAFQVFSTRSAASGGVTKATALIWAKTGGSLTIGARLGNSGATLTSVLVRPKVSP